MSKFKIPSTQLCITFVLFVCYSLTSCEANADYFLARDSIIAKELEMSIAGSVELTDLEQAANENLLKYKINEWSNGFQFPGYYPSIQEVPVYLKEVQCSPIFNILQALPKGALLHTHEVGMSSADYILDLTYRKNLYVCANNEQPFQLKFFNTPDASCSWTLLEDERAKNPCIDNYLRQNLSVLKRTPLKDAKEIGAAMKEVQRIVSGVLGFKKVFKAYLYQVLSELKADGITYVEIRSALSNLYDEDGKQYNHDDIVDIYQEVLSNFQAKHPSFVGLKLIYTAPRNAPDEKLQHHLEIYAHLKDKYGEFIAGFDFDGGEDVSRRLKSQIELLLPPKLSNSIEYYFHAGITNWFGSDSDGNLVDALLLGSKRIGLATTLAKHPILMQSFKEKDIAIEVTPLGARVQGVVQDIRSHPAAILGAYGLPLVIANGSPGLWGAGGVTFDWYLAFMGIAGKEYDLAYLKTLAMNSIKYSALNTEVKEELFEKWELAWNDFVQNLADDTLAAKCKVKNDKNMQKMH